MVLVKMKFVLICAGLPVVAAALLVMRAGREDPLATLLCILIVTFGYIASVYDIRQKRIPNGLVLAMAGLWFVTIMPALLLNTNAVIPLLKDSALGFFVSGGMFLTIYLISKKGLGGGDVKFIAAAGLYLGLSGSITTILCGTLLTAIIGLVLIMFKKIGRKDTIPLAPFLYVGILITLFLS